LANSQASGVLLLWGFLGGPAQGQEADSAREQLSGSRLAWQAPQEERQALPAPFMMAEPALVKSVGWNLEESVLAGLPISDKSTGIGSWQGSPLRCARRAEGV
jgi:hypothetical protein